jgi:hypothetical protein
MCVVHVVGARVPASVVVATGQACGSKAVRWVR